MHRYYIFIASLGVFCLALIIALFFVIGSPISQKGIQLDNERLASFESIKVAVSQFNQDTGKLPTTLTQLYAQGAGYLQESQTEDPQTHKAYTYIVRSPTAYSLCAVFATDSSEDTSSSSMMYRWVMPKHKKGYDCISNTVSPALTPTPDESFTISSPKVNDVLCNGKQYSISWRAPESVQGIAIDLLLPTSQTPIPIVANPIPVNSGNTDTKNLSKGSYVWTVDTSRIPQFVEGFGYKFQVKGISGNSTMYVYSSLFTIKNCTFSGSGTPH